MHCSKGTELRSTSQAVGGSYGLGTRKIILVLSDCTGLTMNACSSQCHEWNITWTAKQVTGLLQDTITPTLIGEKKTAAMYLHKINKISIHCDSAR